MRYLLIFLTSFTMACSQKSGDGTGDTGGGFRHKNAQSLLDSVKTQLASEVRASRSPRLNSLPDGWTKRRFADVIDNIIYDYNNKHFRNNSELLFNYDKSNNKIIAAKGFFDSYASLPTKYLDKYNEDAISLYIDVKRQILHEVSHLFDYNEERAAQFSEQVLDDFFNDFQVCPYKEGERDAQLYFYRMTAVAVRYPSFSFKSLGDIYKKRYPHIPDEMPQGQSLWTDDISKMIFRFDSNKNVQSYTYSYSDVVEEYDGSLCSFSF